MSTESRASERAVEPGAGGERIVILGAGVAGVSAAEAARAASPTASIVLLSNEADLPYYRLNLGRHLAGDIEEKDLLLHPAAWYEERRLALRLGISATSLDLDRRCVVLDHGSDLGYDRLILAMGAYPSVPGIPGTQREGVFTLRTLEDCRKILAWIRPGMPCVCIGGGLLGLEAAGALARRGGRVTVLEGQAWLLPRALDRRGGDRMAEHLRRLSIGVCLNGSAKAIVGDARVTGVLLEDGKSLEAELVLITIGVRPNDDLARDAGLRVDRGLVVDDCLGSSRPGVFGAGDVAQHRGVLYGAWGPSRNQGRIAGQNAIGGTTPFAAMARASAVNVLGLRVISVGEWNTDQGSGPVIEGEDGAAYVRFVFRDHRMAGAILMGNIAAGAAVRKAVEERIDLSALLSAHPTATHVTEFLVNQKGTQA